MVSENFQAKIKNLTHQIEGLAKAASSYIERSKIESLIKDSIQSFVRATRTVDVQVKKLSHFHSAELPGYQTSGSSGFDVRAQINDDLTLKPGARETIPTGLIFEIPEGYEIQVRPRSGWAAKDGITVLNTPGTIDSDYHGEVKIIIANLGQKDVVIRDQDRIAQLVVCPVVRAQLVITDSLSETERGEGGFGSTGTGASKLDN